MSEESDPKTVGGSTNIEQHVDDVPEKETDSTAIEAGNNDKPADIEKSGDAAKGNEQSPDLALEAARREETATRASYGANLFDDSELTRHVGEELPGVVKAAKEGRLNISIMAQMTGVKSTDIAEIPDKARVRIIKNKATADVEAIAQVALPKMPIKEMRKNRDRGDSTKASNQASIEEYPSNAPNITTAKSTQADLVSNVGGADIAKDAAVESNDTVVTATMDSNKIVTISFSQAGSKGKEPMNESQAKPDDEERPEWRKNLSSPRWATDVPDTRDYKQEFVHLRDDHYSMFHQYNKEVEAHRETRKEKAELSQRLLNAVNDHLGESQR